jgi:hypothetical protein
MDRLEQQAREAMELAKDVREMTRAENVHARGIAKHGQNDTPTSRDDVDMLHADLYAKWPATRLDALVKSLRAIVAALSELPDRAPQDDLPKVAERATEAFRQALSTRPDVGGLVERLNTFTTSGDVVEALLDEMIVGRIPNPPHSDGGCLCGRCAMPPGDYRALAERARAALAALPHQAQGPSSSPQSERERIVEWLRDPWWEHGFTPGEIADLIEGGEHLTPPDSGEEG